MTGASNTITGNLPIRLLFFPVNIKKGRVRSENNKDKDRTKRTSWELKQTAKADWPLKIFLSRNFYIKQKKLPSIFHFKALLKHHRDHLHSSSPAAQYSRHISITVAKTGSTRNINCTFKNLISGLIVYYVLNQFNS